jgi:hypothetical protein
MAVPRFRAGSPSLIGVALAALLATPSYASTDPARLISTVREGSLEMTVALADSTYVPGQHISAFICVVNRGTSTLAFAPDPGFPFTFVQLWKIAPQGAWFAMHRSWFDAIVRHEYADPPVCALEPGGSATGSFVLNSLFIGGNTENVSSAVGPTRALPGSRLQVGRYACHVIYLARERVDDTRMRLRVESDTLFFRVVPSPGTPEEGKLLTEYASAIDSCEGNGLCRNRVSSRWLKRFAGTAFFSDIFLSAGVLWPLAGVNLLQSADPNGKNPVRAALMLDLVNRLSSLDRIRPTILAGAPAYPYGSLASRVVSDYRARPRRNAFRDSVYTERRKYLIRGHPPYGRWIEKGDSRRDPTETVDPAASGR